MNRVLLPLVEPFQRQSRTKPFLDDPSKRPTTCRSSWPYMTTEEINGIGRLAALPGIRVHVGYREAAHPESLTRAMLESWPGLGVHQTNADHTPGYRQVTNVSSRQTLHHTKKDVTEPLDYPLHCIPRHAVALNAV